MTTAADDPAVEEAFEACLAGRPVPVEGVALAAFAGAVRATASRSGRPNAALAELLATGLLTDQSSPSTRTARSAGGPPSRRSSRIRNRRRSVMFFPVLLAKLLSAGAVAQAATGAGAVLVAVTGAGAAGVLPDPLQDTVATAVETVTPLDLDGGDEVVGEVVDGDGTGSDAGTVPTGVATTTVPAEPTEAPFDAAVWAEGPAVGESFGSWVSAGAHNKSELEAAAALRGDERFRFGQLVRTWAQHKNVDIEDVEVGGTALEELVEPTPTAAPEIGQETTAPAQQAPSAGTGNRGRPAGSDGGNGGGNSGNGGGNAGKGNGRN